MPVVPISQNRVGISNVSGEKLVAPDLSGTGLEAFGHGFQQLGQGGAELADSLREVELRKTANALKDADNQLLSDGTTLIDDPQTGYLSSTGKDAVDGYAPTLEALKKRAGEIGATLPNRKAREVFARASATRIASWQDALAHHAMNQDAEYLDDVSTTRVALNRDEAVAAYDDVKRQDLALGTIVSEMKDLGERKGWTEEQTRGHTALQVSGAVRAAGIRLAQDAPERAAVYVKAKVDAGQLLGTDAAAVDEAVRISRSRIDAEARRDAAEERARQAHAAEEARDQLGAVKAQLSTGAGTSADWEKVASGYKAIGDDTQAAEAHSRGVETAAAEKYRGADLQTLDQRITGLQASSNLKPDQAAELKGLRALRESTAQRLNQPGGALEQYQYATGRALNPLDQRDPTGFVARAQTAITAARTYGRQTVEPLTAAEAKPLKDLAAGDSVQRLRALETLSQFRDPRAIEGAARQVAGSDDGGFRIAATLMTLPGSAGLDAAREILSGQEAAKTIAPNVYLPAAAKTEFQNYAGAGLRGLSPGYASDLMTAAENIYVTRAAARQQQQWNSDAWHAAIDTALGSYKDANGVKLGGVTTYKGVPVVLPPGWSSDGLLRRLARADGKDWSAATVSHSPIWPDGSPVNSGQLRDLVPSRLGGTRYGFLTKSGGYLQAKGGGPYVLDVAKVPWK